jgi:hypothetical protein
MFRNSDVDLDWIKSAWVGTTVIGSIFGAFSGAIGIGSVTFKWYVGLMVGGVVGLFIAGVVGAFVIPGVAATLWVVFWSDRHNLVGRSVGGALTGLISAGFSWPICIVTAIAGGIGAVLPVFVSQNDSSLAPKKPLQFTVRDVLLRILVIAILSAVWVAGYKLCTR